MQGGDDDRPNQPRLAVNNSGGRSASAEVFRSVFEDRVIAVGLVGGWGYKDLGVGGVKNAWCRGTSNTVCCPAVRLSGCPAVRLLGVEVRDVADYEPPGLGAVTAPPCPVAPPRPGVLPGRGGATGGQGFGV